MHMSTLCTGLLIVLVSLQVFTSSISIRKDVDNGSAVVGDLHRKNPCLLLSQGEVQESMLAFCATQLSLLNCGFSLKDPLMDIAPDVPLNRLLIGEFPPSPKLSPLRSPKMVVVDVQDTINVVAPINLALPP